MKGDADWAVEGFAHGFMEADTEKYTNVERLKKAVMDYLVNCDSYTDLSLAEARRLVEVAGEIAEWRNKDIGRREYDTEG